VRTEADDAHARQFTDNIIFELGPSPAVD